MDRAAQLRYFDQSNYCGLIALGCYNETAATHPVRAGFVFLHLLKGDANSLGKLLLCNPPGQTGGADVLANELVGGFDSFIRMLFAVVLQRVRQWA